MFTVLLATVLSQCPGGVCLPGTAMLAYQPQVRVEVRSSPVVRSYSEDTPVYLTPTERVPFAEIEVLDAPYVLSRRPRLFTPRLYDYYDGPVLLERPRFRRLRRATLIW